MSDEAGKERATIVQKILGAKKGSVGESKPQPTMGEKEKYSCHDEHTGKEQR
jgi:hypothetical protein